jgi:hypothetical protein
MSKKFYKITIEGPGTESNFIKLTKAQYDFWVNYAEENCEDDIAEFIVNAEDPEVVNALNIPEGCNFTIDKDGDVCDWTNLPNAVEHTYGADYYTCNFSVDEVAGPDANYIKAVITNELLDEYMDEVMDEAENWDLCTTAGTNVVSPDYVLQAVAAQKGNFFTGIIQTEGEFDPLKLNIHTLDNIGGERLVTEVYYEGNELENEGGDANSKGLSVSMWTTL